MGMIHAARLSEDLGFAPSGTAQRLAALCAAMRLPTEAPVFPRKAYLEALRVDKKKRDSRIRYIVLKGIGEADSVPLTPAEIMTVRRRREPLVAL